MQYNEEIWKGVYSLYESLVAQSIILYWAITFYSWEEGVFDLWEIASGVRTYSLRKSHWMSSSKYLWKVQQWMVWCPLQSWYEQYSSDLGSDGLD